MYEKISIEEAKELISKGWYKDSLSKLEFDSSTPPWVQENEKINFVRIVYSNAYLRKYPDRVYTEETVSSSVVSAPKVSSDAHIE